MTDARDATAQKLVWTLSLEIAVKFPPAGAWAAVKKRREVRTENVSWGRKANISYILERRNATKGGMRYYQRLTIWPY